MCRYVLDSDMETRLAATVTINLPSPLPPGLLLCLLHCKPAFWTGHQLMAHLVCLQGAGQLQTFA